jgi:hypothetical protein
MAFLVMTRTNIIYHGKKTVAGCTEEAMGGENYSAAGFPLLAYVSQHRALVRTITNNVPVTGGEYRDVGKHESSRLEGRGWSVVLLPVTSA